MKRYALILSVAIALVCSCEDMGDSAGSGTGSTLHECVLPESVYAGGEGIIQWNGFADDVELYLVSEDGTRHSLGTETVTPSGMIFNVPSSVPAGLYELFMSQDGNVTALGHVTVLEPGIPVRNLSVPDSAYPGDEVQIEGVGFEDGMSVVLVDASGTEHVPQVKINHSGLMVLLPEDVAEGEYDLYLVHDGRSWLLCSGFEICRVSVIKELKSISLHVPYIQSATLLYTWEVTRGLPAELLLSEYLVEDGVPSLSVYDRYVSADGTMFVLEHDGFESSNDIEMTYSTDGSGRVTGTDVLIYGNSQTTPFTWSYDADGRVLEIVSPKLTFRSFAYEDGNLVGLSNAQFGYEDPLLVNEPDAPDVVWAYMAMMERNDPFVYFPYLLGWYAEASGQLPTSLVKPSPSGTGTLTCDLSYVFDDDGYVTSMSWTEGDEDYSIGFEYSF